MTPQKLDKAALEAALDPKAWAEAVKAPYLGVPIWVALADGMMSAPQARVLIAAYLASLPPDPERALVKKAEVALGWALPLACLALEDHRVERLRCGHNDIGRDRGTDLGLWDDEVNSRAQALATLQSIKDADHERD